MNVTDRLRTMLKNPRTMTEAYDGMSTKIAALARHYVASVNKLSPYLSVNNNFSTPHIIKKSSIRIHFTTTMFLDTEK